MLKSEKFQQDPRVAQAQELLLATLKDHQKSFTGIQPADPARKIPYEEMLKRFTAIRGNELYFPYIGSGFGKGSLVELMDGSVKYDFVEGIGPHIFGHSHPRIVKTCLDAALSDTVMQGHLQQNHDTFELSELLCKVSKFPHCFLSAVGAMANENALKLAFQKNYPAQRILAFDRTFTGRTLATTQITDRPIFREGLPTTYQVDYVPFYDGEHSVQTTLNALKAHIQRYPKQHAVMILELVQGEGGFHLGTPEFFKAIIALLKENKIAVLIDEVQTFGRTPSLFAFQEFGLEGLADIVTIGKIAQVCATLFTEEYKSRQGLLSQTFISSTSAIRTSKALIEILLSEGYYGKDGRMSKIHQEFVLRFEQMKKKHPHIIHGPYGLGSMVAFTPFEGIPAKTEHLVRQLYENGLMTFFAGRQPMRIRLLVPAVDLAPGDIEQACNIIEKTLLDHDR